MNMHKLSYLLREVEPPTRLLGVVDAQVSHARLLTARIHAALFSIFTIVSGIVLVPVLQYASEELYTSGFTEYMKLLFSDTNVALSAWQTFAFSLFESLPSLAILLTLGVGVAFIWSLRGVFRDAPTAFGHASLAA